MAQKKKVEGYILSFKKNSKEFLFWYQVDGIQNCIHVSPQEFMALADMFRNEGPIYFDGERFDTSVELVGEEERSAP